MSQSIWVPHKSPAEEDRERREREERRARSEQLSRLQASYAELKKVEAVLVAVVDSVTPTTDYKLLFRAEGELSALRRVLASFPEEVRAAYRVPASGQDSGEWERQRARQLRAELESIERHELPALEAKLHVIPTARELAMWAGDPDPRARHYNLVREQIAARRARAEQCRAELARA